MADKRSIEYSNSDLPNNFNRKIRKYFEGKICPICGYEMNLYHFDEAIGYMKSIRRPTIQHNVPISLGGKHELSNISVICHNCNVSIQNTITDELNNKEMISAWQKLNGLR